MKKLISSAAVLYGIYLTSSGLFAGQWTEVPGAAGNYSGLEGVAAVSAADVWAVGGSGQLTTSPIIEHWDGNAWSVSSLGTQSGYLWSVAAGGSDDVWAVGQNEIAQTLVEHWDGEKWLVVPSPSVGRYSYLGGVSVISRNDAWAVGESHTYFFLHWNGRQWSVVHGPPANESRLNAVKAFASNDVWAVGYKDSDPRLGTSSTFVLHWDGTVWSEIPSPNADLSNNLWSIDGVASNDLWAVGQSAHDVNPYPLAAHWDGTSWTIARTSANYSAAFFGVAAISSTKIIAVGWSASGTEFSARWDGTQWRSVPTPPVLASEGRLQAVSARDGSLWAVGGQGFDPDELILNWTQSTDLP